jgi:hypothetical protein
MPELKDILADIPNEGSDPFKDLEKDTPPESLPDKKPEEEKPPEGDVLPEDNLPFHKHSRWIERETELDRLRERDEENTKIIQELAAFKEEYSKKTESTDIPDWFRELYGENLIAWQKYSEYEQVRTDEIEKKVVARQEEFQRKTLEDTTKWNNWVDAQLVKLGNEKGVDFVSQNDTLPDGTKTNSARNELIKTMLDYRPTDENNNFDFQKGYKIHEILKGKPDTSHSNARKALADTTTKVTGGEKPPKDYMTSNELRRTSWGNL